MAAHVGDQSRGFQATETFDPHFNSQAHLAPTTTERGGIQGRFIKRRLQPVLNKSLPAVTFRPSGVDEQEMVWFHGDGGSNSRVICKAEKEREPVEQRTVRLLRPLIAKRPPPMTPNAMIAVCNPVTHGMEDRGIQSIAITASEGIGWII